MAVGEKKQSKQERMQEKQKRKEEKKLKQALKTERKQLKQERRDLEQEDEEDINATMKRLVSSSSTKTCVSTGQLVSCDPPTPRVHFTLTTTPANDLILYGGQYFDGQSQFIYGDLYRWNIEENLWRRLSQENGVHPPPRAAHQTVLHNKNLYVFGGEYATTRQFYHYKDFWRFDLRTNTWKEVKASGTGPSQRSGHRMVVWKSYIVVFGGFYDTFRDSAYYNDLHMYSINEERWEKVEVSGVPPSVRGGAAFFLNTLETGPVGTAFVYGGYHRDKKTSGVALDDLWMLSIRPSPNKCSWERLSRRGTGPGKRSGFAVSPALKGGRVLFFGGVCDLEKPGLSLQSTFFNDLHCFDFARKKFFAYGNAGPAKLSRALHGSGAGAASGAATAGKAEDFDSDSSEDESGEYSNFETSEAGVAVPKQPGWMFEYIDDQGKLCSVFVEEEFPEARVDEDADKAEPLVQAPAGAPTGAQEAADVAQYAPVLTPVPEEARPATETSEAPRPRIGATLVSRGNQLILYGGISETDAEDREVTFDDCWVLDLKTRKWTKKVEGTMHLQKWLGEADSEAEDEEELEALDASDSDFLASSSSSEDEDDDDGDDKEEERPQAQKETAPVAKKKAVTLREKIEQFQVKHDLADTTRTPLFSESLKDFFARTKDHWMKLGEAQIAQDDMAKDLRRVAFGLAQERFESLRPLLEKLASFEEEQKEAENKKTDKKKSGKTSKAGK